MNRGLLPIFLMCWPYSGDGFGFRVYQHLPVVFMSSSLVWCNRLG